MAVPWGNLQAQRSRVLPQGGAVLGQLTGRLQQGLEQGRLRAAEDDAPNVLMNYLDTLGAGYGQQPTLGNLTGGMAPQPAATVPFDGRPTRANAEQQAATGGVDAGVQLLDQFEGFRSTPYEDWSYRPGTGERYMSGMRIGYGQTIPGAQSITEEQAQAALRQQIEQQYIPSIVSTVGADVWGRLNPDQQGVLISLAHNYGSIPGRIVPALQSGDSAAAAAAIAALGGDNSGINQRRREAEAMAFARTGQPMAGGAPAAGGGGFAAPQPQTPAWSPPTGAERAQLRALMINPATRQMGYQLAVQRMTPPEPVQPNWQLQEFNGTLYRIDANTGQAQPVIQGQPSGPEWQPFTDPVSGWSGRRNAAGDIEWNPEGMQPQTAETGEPPTDVQIYDYYVQQETRDGRTPKSFNEWDLERRGRLGGIDPSVAEQRYNLLYQNAARELPILEETWASLGDLGNQAAERLPAIIGNWIVTPDYQRALSAMTQVVQMQTYALTGAAATNPEAERIARTLLPAIGDGPQVIADKLQRTRDAISFIRGASGTAGTIPVAPPPAAPPTATPLAPGEAPNPAVIWQWDPATNTLVPVSPR